MVRPLTCILCSTLTLTLAACSADVGSSEPVDEEGAVQAAILIEQQASVDPSGATYAQALAGFVSVPLTVDPTIAMQLVGFEPDWPSMPGCRQQGNEQAPALSEMANLELLDVGTVEVETRDASAKLTPYVFPTVTDSIAGLMYTSREVTTGHWPASSEYRVRATGGAVPPLALSARAPEALTAVTVGGIPLASADIIDVDEPIDLTWAVGQPGDIVWVELTTQNGASESVCAFDDESGVGTIPAHESFESGPGTLTIHRSRSIPFVAAGVEHGTVRFDFGLSQNVKLSSNSG